VGEWESGRGGKILFLPSDFFTLDFFTLDRKHPGYKPPDSFRKQTQDPEIKNLYPMKLAPRIYPWGQGFNLKSKI